jgi:hypothetical protein
MASLGELVYNIISETNMYQDDSLPEKGLNGANRMVPGQGSNPGQIDLARSINFGIYKILKIVRDDPNWQTRQARRKFDKEDILYKNPGFDPIFMKI